MKAKHFMVMLSMLFLIVSTSVTASANEINVANERKDALAYGFLMPVMIIVLSIGGLILYECIRRKRNNRDKLF